MAKRARASAAKRGSASGKTKPRRAIKRASGGTKTKGRPRAQFETTRGGSYEGAQSRRRLSNWQPSRASINALLAADGPVLRARARDLIRNNPYASSACDSFVANLIGRGIRPASMHPDKSVRRALHDSFADWTVDCDADGVSDFYGMQATVARALFEAGEVFIRKRARDPDLDDHLTVPLQLQLLESEMLPFEKNEIGANGNRILNGVEFDAIGRRVAYWFWQSNPADIVLLGTQALPVRVPADQVLHIFKPLRPGQVRGIPWITPSVVALWLLDQYDDAELDRKKIAAMFAGFVESPDPSEVFGDIEPGNPALDPTMDEFGQRVAPEDMVTLEPGTMQYLNPGEKVSFSSPAEVGGSYEMFQYRNGLRVCAGAGVPYFAVTGDLKRANYSSLRGAIIEFRRRLEQTQHQVIAHQMCRPVWKRWMTDGVIAGELTLPDFGTQARIYVRARWITPNFDWVDPLKEIQAEKIAVDELFKPRSDVQTEMGFEPEEADERIAQDQARELDLGLQRPKTQAQVPPVDPDAVDPEEAAQEAADNAGEDAAANAA